MDRVSEKAAAFCQDYFGTTRVTIDDAPFIPALEQFVKDILEEFIAAAKEAKLNGDPQLELFS